MKHLSIITASTLLLTACSTITSGTTQPLTVLTPGVEGAECTLVDTKPSTWRVQKTPETVEVNKGDGPMTITCKKSGFKTTEYVMEERFAGATLGNVLIGGGVGIIVDAASGAAQDYPDDIKIWMEPNKWSSSDAKAKWMAERDAYYESLKPKTPSEQQQAPASTGNFNKKS